MRSRSSVFASLWMLACTRWMLGLGLAAMSAIAACALGVNSRPVEIAMIGMSGSDCTALLWPDTCRTEALVLLQLCLHGSACMQTAWTYGRGKHQPPVSWNGTATRHPLPCERSSSGGTAVQLEAKAAREH